jgi:GxxExxY protein
VYHAAMRVELQYRGVPFESEISFPMTYRGKQLPVYYRADLICFETVIVEIKATGGIKPADCAQVINYLRASGLRTAVLLNFGGRTLEYRRFAGDSLVRPI